MKRRIGSEKRWRGQQRIMLAQALILLIFASGSGIARDAALREAYRLDALQTQALNKRALAEIRKLPLMTAAKQAVPAAIPQDETREEQLLRQRLDAAMQRWRDEVAACRTGNKQSCNR